MAAWGEFQGGRGTARARGHGQTRHSTAQHSMTRTSMARHGTAHDGTDHHGMARHEKTMPRHEPATNLLIKRTCQEVAEHMLNNQIPPIINRLKPSLLLETQHAELRLQISLRSQAVSSLKIGMVECVGRPNRLGIRLAGQLHRIKVGNVRVPLENHATFHGLHRTLSARRVMMIGIGLGH